MSEPLVGSEGNLDPFDGLVTCRLLRDPAGERAARAAAACRLPRGPLPLQQDTPTARPATARRQAWPPLPPHPLPAAAGGDPSVLAAEVADFERMVEHKHRR